MNPFKMFSGDQSSKLPTATELREQLLKQYTESVNQAGTAVITVGGGGGGSGGGAGGSGGVYVSDGTATRRVQQGSFSDPYGQANITSDLHRMRMIMMRLRVTEASNLPFQHISTGLGGDHVFVFIVQNGEPVTLRDDAAMFPSDTLITQLRLLTP